MGDTLKAGESLSSTGTNQLVSQNGLFRLTMQADGNLVLYGPSADGRTGPNATALWESNTDGTGANTLELSLGQLCVSKYSSDGSWTRGLWSTTNPTGETELILQDDGNLVLVDTKTRDVLWSRDNWQSMNLDRVILVQPDGSTDVVRALITYAEGAIQKSVNLFGTPGNTTLPPDTDAQLADWNLLDTVNLSESAYATNEKTAELIAQAQMWKDSTDGASAAADLAATTSDTTMAQIGGKIDDTNAQFQVIQPAISTDPDAEAWDANNYYLNAAQVRTVLDNLYQLLGDVETKVADAARANKEAEEKLTPPVEDPPVEDPPAENPPAENPPDSDLWADDPSIVNAGMDPGFFETTDPASYTDDATLADLLGGTGNVATAADLRSPAGRLNGIPAAGSPTPATGVFADWPGFDFTGTWSTGLPTMSWQPPTARWPLLGSTSWQLNQTWFGTPPQVVRPGPIAPPGTDAAVAPWTPDAPGRSICTTSRSPDLDLPSITTTIPIVPNPIHQTVTPHARAVMDASDVMEMARPGTAGTASTADWNPA
ncbi:hypothetical protein OH799_33420 [Nocardia sp. NBC_00881]|uniref:hypothetical protein n=1 Tax=Nocardia sp. NBC_00881 TaxID=2975995 RepID=UPI00386B201B|nr:hypothetical protein OH799_33420 [Nocardia sp. NBC_00881]